MKPIKEIEFYCKSNAVTKGGVEVYEAFPVDSEREDKSTPESWATKRFPYVNGERKEPIPPVVFKYNNKFDNIRIVEIDHRGNGGRAYKVIINAPDGKKFFIDLREKALLDTILHAGIRPEGYLNGEFAFVRDKSQTNLVRCDSKEYQEAIEISRLKTTQKAIPTKELKPMTLYQRGVGDKEYVLYVGEGYVPVIDEVIGGDSEGYRGAVERIRDVKATKAKKSRIFIDIYSLENDQDIEEIKEEISDYDIKVTPTTKVYREVMTINDQQLYHDLIKRARDKKMRDLEWKCSLYPHVYSPWGYNKTMYHLDKDDYKKTLTPACFGLTKEEALANLEKYKNYHIEKGKYNNETN